MAKKAKKAVDVGEFREVKVGKQIEKIPFLSEAAKVYADLRGVDISRARADKAVIVTIEEYIREKINDQDLEKLECERCAFPIFDEDTFCAFCGGDVTEDDTGGFEKWLLENDLSNEKPKAKKKSKKKEGPEEDPGEGPEEDPGEGPEEDPGEGPEEDPGEGPEEDPGEESEEPAAIGATIEERIQRIADLENNMRKTSGGCAHKLGCEFFQISESRQYVESGHDTFQDFVEDKKNGVGMSYAHARNCVRIFQSFTLEQAERLGVSRAIALANAPEAVVKKMLKEGKGGVLKGEALTAEEVKGAVKKARSQEKTDITEQKRGRKPKPKFMELTSLSKTARLKKTKNGEYMLLWEFDEFIALQMVVTPGKNGDTFNAQVEFVELAPEKP
jgi:hypothetical protein